MAEPTVSVSFIRMPEQTIEHVEMAVPTSARGYHQRLVDVCAEWARMYDYAYWVQPHQDEWLVFRPRRRDSTVEHCATQPTREAAEMWVIHRGS